jgi:hypothetical protein
LPVEIAPSARKHGVRDDQIRFVIEHCGRAFDQPAPQALQAKVVWSSSVTTPTAFRLRLWPSPTRPVPCA